MSERLARLGVIVATAALLLGAMWVATQRGPAPQAPRAMASVLFLAVDSAAVLVPLWLAALGWGYPLRRWALHDMRFATVAQAGAGMAAMLLAGWCWACFSLDPRHLWVLAGAGWLMLALQLTLLARRHGLASRSINVPLPWTLPLAAAPLGLMLVAASCPPGTLWAIEAYGYDVMSYHLQLPREWLDAGRMSGLHHNAYSFLPGLMESAYAWLGAASGSVLDAIYAAQMLHLSLAAYAAVAVGCLVATAAGARAGVAAAAIVLAMPWTIVTGSMAYNDATMLAFAAAALLVACDPVSERWPGAGAIGLLVGAAILAKPSAGLLVAVPLGVLLLTRWNHVLPWRPTPTLKRGLIVTAIVAAAALLTISPWLVRNAIQTGNPLFPFACRALGYGHWDAQLAARWDQAHGLTLDAGLAPRAAAVAQQWLFNTGYGGIGGAVQTRQATRVAVFDSGGGFPVLWSTAAVGLALSLGLRQTRRLALAMAAILVVQLAFWATLTHLQSRFLLPTLLPGVVLAGLAFGRLDAILSPRRWWLVPSIVIFVVAALTASSFNEFFSQVRPGLDPWDVVDSLQRGVAHHELDNLPPNSKVLLVADAGGLLYIDPAIQYATAFDRSPLGALLDEAQRSPAFDVTDYLRSAGYRHVWVSWSELARLHGTYGHDPLVTEPAVRHLAATQRWTPVADLGHATLYRLP